MRELERGLDSELLPQAAPEFLVQLRGSSRGAQLQVGTYQKKMAGLVKRFPRDQELRDLDGFPQSLAGQQDLARFTQGIEPALIPRPLMFLNPWRMHVDQQRELQQFEIVGEGWRVRPVRVGESIVCLLPVAREHFRDAYGLALRDHQLPGCVRPRSPATAVGSACAARGAPPCQATGI